MSKQEMCYVSELLFTLLSLLDKLKPLEAMLYVTACNSLDRNRGWDDSFSILTWLRAESQPNPRKFRGLPFLNTICQPFSGIKWPGHEAHQKSQSNARVKNSGFIPPLPTFKYVVHRNNFDFLPVNKK
jgi:hypothetical protein